MTTTQEQMRLEALILFHTAKTSRRNANGYTAEMERETVRALEELRTLRRANVRVPIEGKVS
jgi:hypothetical protein